MDSSVNKLVIAAENPLSDECLTLISYLSAELGQRYGDDGGASSFNPEEVTTHGAVFLAARHEGQPIGCGAIRRLEPGVAEVKRMFVIPEARGRGVARLILTELESAALRMGYNRIRLETGLRQPEAIGLYEAAGYHRVACYGGYADDPMSVCFEKHLAAGDASLESHEI